VSKSIKTDDKADHAKREVPRYALTSHVQVMDKGTGMREYGRLSEISRKGCFFDIDKTMPVGTPVVLEKAIESGKFATDGAIIYTKAGVGMGIAFRDSSAEQLEILDAWLGANVSRC
jgi:hypothetical protein